MNYKETLFFIGKCLTISHEAHNKILIEKELKSAKIDWDNVVKVATSHYVFPALYCNLKRVNFLHYLPKDLVEYMKHITDLNRKRNIQIIEQAKEINELLLANNITPIFLKGTGNLLEGLYEDIAERMVGDIDFLVSKNEFKKTIKILENDGYFKDDNKIDSTIFNRHYPKIIKKNKIASLEIHYKMVTNEKDFNYEYVSKRLLTNNFNETTLSYFDKILLTSYNKQINEDGYLLHSISLRNSYDLYLLSKKTYPLKVFKEFKYHFNEFNSFLASTNLAFNNPLSLSFLKDKKVKSYLEKINFYLENPEKGKKHIKKFHFYKLQKNRTIKVLKAFYKKEYFNYFYLRSYEILGLKKPKPNS